VVCRTILNGSGGRGIVIAETEDQLVQAPLYTKYVKKKDEYRIHIARDLRRDITEVIDVQKKARRLDSGPVNWRIRNLENGFIYKRQDVNPPQHVLDNSIRALQVSGLDFGAVDIIVNANEDRSYVLEINSAPGLEGTTLESYTNYFKNFL
jgi:glutathione synthase/RimK-type ligase-like ATP-grasp enzyme